MQIQNEELFDTLLIKMVMEKTKCSEADAKYIIYETEQGKSLLQKLKNGSLVEEEQQQEEEPEQQTTQEEQQKAELIEKRSKLIELHKAKIDALVKLKEELEETIKTHEQEINRLENTNFDIFTNQSPPITTNTDDDVNENNVNDDDDDDGYDFEDEEMLNQLFALLAERGISPEQAAELFKDEKGREVVLDLWKQHLQETMMLQQAAPPPQPPSAETNNKEELLETLLPLLEEIGIDKENAVQLLQTEKGAELAMEYVKKHAMAKELEKQEAALREAGAVDVEEKEKEEEEEDNQNILLKRLMKVLFDRGIKNADEAVAILQDPKGREMAFKLLQQQEELAALQESHSRAQEKMFELQKQKDTLNQQQEQQQE